MTPQPPVPPQPPAPLAPLAPTLPVPPPNGSVTPITDVALRWIKESVTALLGVVLVLCLIVMVWKAFGFIGDETDKAKAYERVRDLLLFINPLVGVVIGYYFNRVSTEARAESAERTAQGATTTALQASAARDEAQAQAQQNRVEADEAKFALEEIIPAAQGVLTQLPETPMGPLAGPAGVGGGGAQQDALRDARRDLRTAIERARAIGSRGRAA